MGGSVSKRQIEFNDHVDLEKCMGKWYFIASNGTPFERGHRNSTLTYIRSKQAQRQWSTQFKLSLTVWSVSPKNTQLKAKVKWRLVFSCYVLDVDPDYQ